MCGWRCRRYRGPSACEPGVSPASTPAARQLRAFAGLWLAYLATFGLFNPYAPLWFQALGMSTLAIGAIASLQSWTRLLAPYAWSWAADHSGQRVTLIRLAAAGCLLGAIGLALAPSLAGTLPWYTTLLIPGLVALLFLANGGIVPLAEAALAHLVSGPNGLDAARYGRVRMWGSVGFIGAVLAGGLALQTLGIAAFPWLVVLLNGALVVVAWRLPTAHEDRHTGAPAPAVLPLLRQPAVAWFLASVFFTVLAHTSLYAFFSLFLVHGGYGKQAVGALWAVSVVMEVLFFRLQGRWFKQLSPHGWLAVAAGVTALRFAGMALAGAQLWVLVLAQLTHAITFAAHHAACIALISQHFPGRLRGRGQALYSALGYGLSGLLGGVGGGWLIERFGFAALYGAATLAGLLALACVGLSWRAERPLRVVCHSTSG